MEGGGLRSGEVLGIVHIGHRLRPKSRAPCTPLAGRLAGRGGREQPGGGAAAGTGRQPSLSAADWSRKLMSRHTAFPPARSLLLRDGSHPAPPSLRPSAGLCR